MSRTIPTTGNASISSSAYDTHTFGTLGKPVHLGFTNGPSVDEYGIKTLTEQIKGDFKTLRELNLVEFKVGNERPTDLFTSGAIATCFAAPEADLAGKKKWYITSSNVEEQEAGDHAIMTITYTSKKKKSTTSQEEEEAEEITETWQLECQETSQSIYSYCYADELGVEFNNQQWLKLWEEGTTDLYKNHQFTNPEDGQVYTLTEAGQAIAKHISNGLTDVKAWSPVVVRTRIYTSGKLEAAEIGKDLCTIDTPDYPAWENTLIQYYEWLKIGDELTAEFSGFNVVKQVRTERWIGTRTKLPEEFYSKDRTKRWKIPMKNVIEYESSSSTDTSTESE